MTQGEWMKGCPEGSEQSFLFGLYNELSQGKCTCPHCGEHSVMRKKSDFFALYVSRMSDQYVNARLMQPQSEFSTYVTQLRKVVERTCPLCKKDFCLACSEPVDRKKESYNALFHCANMQGAILGVGLAMVERMLAEQNSDASREEGSNGKRRKADAAATPHDSDDAMDASPAALKKAKKQKKGGIGYAGDVKEDVSAL
jgi:hypothetical protein